MLIVNSFYPDQLPLKWEVWSRSKMPSKIKPYSYPIKWNCGNPLLHSLFLDISPRKDFIKNLKSIGKRKKMPLLNCIEILDENGAFAHYNEQVLHLQKLFNPVLWRKGLKLQICKKTVKCPLSMVMVCQSFSKIHNLQICHKMGFVRAPDNLRIDDSKIFISSQKPYGNTTH